MTDERALGDPGPDGPVTDTTPTEATTPEGFDFAAFLAGATPVHRTIRVHNRGDLIAESDRLADQLQHLASVYDDGDLDDAARADVEAQFARARADLDRVREQYQASGIEWTVRGRSAEWLEQWRRDYAKAHGFKLTKDGLVPDEHGPDARDALLAELTVTPVGVTAEQVTQLREVLPREHARIDAACTAALTQSGEQAFGMTADFSLRPSTNPAGRVS